MEHKKVLASDHLCFFIYSIKASSNSSLTFLAEPVLFTTNLIQLDHVSFSMFIDVLAFSPNMNIYHYMVIKVNGNYHNLNIMMWYNGTVVIW